MLRWTPKPTPKGTKIYQKTKVQKTNEKCSKMEAKRVPKCLVGTAQIGLETTLATSSMLGGSKGAFTSPQSAHFELLYSPFGRQFQYPAAVMALPPTYIWLGKFISHFV